MLVEKRLSTGTATSGRDKDNKDDRANVFGVRSHTATVSNGARNTNARDKNGSKPQAVWTGGSLQYPIPVPYRELLDRVRNTAGASSHTKPEAVNGQASEQGDAHEISLDSVDPTSAAESKKAEAESPAHFSFWPAAKQLALRRLESKNQPDTEPWEHRAAKFHESLWVEELRIELEMVDWRLTAGSLPNIADGLYKLDITALSDTGEKPLEEKGLLRGISVHLKSSGGSTFRTMVQPGSGAGSLLLGCRDPALADAKPPFEVRFHPNRFQQLAMHRALDAPQNSDFLRAACDEAAPSNALGAMDESANTLPASLNDDQRRAVAAVLAATSKRPVIIWGPPGTGKSTLAAFVIWHLVQQRPTNLHILAAAPSNTGADVLCSKLAKLGLDSSQVCRLNALGRSVDTVPDDIRKFCFTVPGENGRPAFGLPQLSKARTFKVIVTTCIASTHLVNAVRSEASSGWFSHVIVDEAAEATEPETLVPLTLLRKVGGAAVLLGDHFQLGPLVMSRLASKLASLEVSMIERLANERFSMVRDGGDRTGLSRDTLLACEDHGLFFLTESYRSHPAICEMYSNMFYASQLQHCERAQQFAALPFFEGLGFTAPVIFHNVVGQERRDPDSSSVYNVEELRIVQQYLGDLLTHDSLGLKPSDVGVITPYTKQLQTLEKELSTSYAGLECGTVEWFQGQERSIVIMSTVRCSRLADGSVVSGSAERRPIGFVADPKRLNVAISRAVAGLIVVGDLQTLALHSSHWRELIEMAKALGSITGEPLLEGPRGGPALELTSAGPEVAKTAVPCAQASAAWDALTGS